VTFRSKENIMSTVTKEVAALTKKRDDLAHEREQLISEAEGRQRRNENVGDLAQRIGEIESGLNGLMPDLKQAKREAGQDAVRKLAGDAGFQATLREALGVLMPLVALSDGVNRLRGQGVALDVLPRPLLEVVAATKAYVEYLVRRGVLKEEE
jgi:hypothetical protein